MYIDPEALKVFLEMFEGPLDLLLFLIRKQNFDILTIPITKITDQYLQYINSMQILNIDLAAEYLLMAAILLAIKSRVLLPRPNSLTIEEEGNEIDPRQELMQKLREYEQIKLSAIKLSELPTAEQDYLWLNIDTRTTTIVFPNISASDLSQAWRNLLMASLLSSNKEQYIKQPELSLRAHMTNILRALSNKKEAFFTSLFDIKQGIKHLIVSFVAILELTKEGLINIATKDNNIFVCLI